MDYLNWIFDRAYPNRIPKKTQTKVKILTQSGSIPTTRSEYEKPNRNPKIDPMKQKNNVLTKLITNTCYYSWKDYS